MFCRSVGNYFDLLEHQSLHLSVLEIGADTGGAAPTIMQVSGGTEDDVPRFERYTYTDISNANLDHVKETFPHLSDLVTYKDLDIELDSLKKGCEAQTYDIIVAAHVLRGCNSITGRLKKVHKLLKHGTLWYSNGVVRRPKARSM